MEEDGMCICVICKKIFPDEDGLIKHKRAQHPQMYVNSVGRISDNNHKSANEMSTNPFRNGSLTITRINGESNGAIKKGGLNQNPVRKGAASQSINARRAEMKSLKQSEGLAKARPPVRSPSSSQGVLNDDDNTTWQKWVQRDTVQREIQASGSSDGTIITPSAAERATSAFCNSTAELTPRARTLGKAQLCSVTKKGVPSLIRMVPNAGKRLAPGVSNQRPVPVATGGVRASSSAVPDIMQNLGKIKSLNQQAQVRPNSKLISIPGGGGGGVSTSSTTGKKSAPTPPNQKQVPVPALRMGKPPQVPKNKAKILPRNAYNNALPKPGVNPAPPRLQVEPDEMDFEDDLTEEDLYNPPELTSEKPIGKKSAHPSSFSKSGPTPGSKATNGGGKQPPQKTLSANRFNPISGKKSAPPPAASVSRDGYSASKPSAQPQQSKTSTSGGSKLGLKNGSGASHDDTQPSENVVVVAKKSAPKTIAPVVPKRIRLKDLKLAVPKMPGKNYEMPSLDSVSSYINDRGHQVWVCLVCNEKEEEESSRDMIACDACEDWYHWGCVGIFSTVPEDQPWYCKRCIFQNCANPMKEFPKLFKSNVPP